MSETAQLTSTKGNGSPKPVDTMVSSQGPIEPAVNSKAITKQDNRIKRPEQNEIDRIAEISMKIRQGIRATLPTPPEQFFTVMVPGKVLNLDDYIAKGNHVIKPRFVQLAEAILCDDMPALGPVQLGPTGRSVSRSYAATLSKLCPAGSTTGIDDLPADKLSEQSKRYKKAMDWLTESVYYRGQKYSRIDLYRQKQDEYTEAFEKKAKAFRDALDLAMKDPRNVTDEQKRVAYDNWVAENYKTYRNKCQAAYMDWVTNGKKEETEYWFSIVDNDSAMSRVEASKEAMRNLAISDEDGAVEYQKVKLTPSNWATLAKEKAYGSSSTSTDALKFNISRLQKINTVIRGMLTAKKGSSTVEVVANDASSDTELKKVEDAVVGYVAALKAKLKAGSSAAAKEAADNKLAILQKEIDITQKADSATQNLETLYFAKHTDLEFQYKTNTNLIAQYQREVEEIEGSQSVSALQNIICKELKISPAISTTPKKDAADYWTKIVVKITKSESGDRTEVSTSSESAGADTSYVDFGLWSVGGAHSGSFSSESESSRTASGAIKELSSSNVEISFDCMRVDIHRAWLRGELFYDHDLKPAPGPNECISPGPVTLATLLDSNSYEPPVDASGNKMTRDEFLEKYHLFPMYPTAFLLAANITLKLEGQFSATKEYFEKNTSSHAQHNRAINYGPFCIRGGASSSSSSSGSAAKSAIADSQCITTDSGLEIKIKSPQVIGTISQILPTLPRRNQK